MKYIITGSLGHISKPITQLLIQAGHEVSVISSNTNKRAEIEQLGASALIGSLEDESFLTQAFTGADAVYTMIPPNLQTANWSAFIDQISGNYRKAVQTSGVRKVVNLSSMGAHIAQGGGLVSLYHQAEQQWNELVDIDIIHLRPASFYTNFLGNIGMIKHMGILGNNYGDVELPMTHPADIAQAAFSILSGANFSGKAVHYVVSDERSTAEIARVLGTSIGLPNLPWVQFSNEETKKGLVQAGLSEDVANNLVAMGQTVARGESVADYRKHRSTLYSTKLEDFAQEFAQAYAAA